jgi:flagellar assembly protein FliH
MNARKSAVLRNVALHMQPRALVRPRRAQLLVGDNKPAGPPSWCAHASEALTTSPAEVPTETPVDDTYDTAFAQGLRAGRDHGLEQGLADAQLSIADAVQAAERTAQVQAQALLERHAAAHAERIGRLDHLVMDLESAIQARLAALEQDAVALAHGALCKIVGDGVLDPEMVSAVVAQAMRQLGGATPLRVRISELDLQLLHNSPQGRALMAARNAVEWLADSALLAGGCVLETERGSLDARLQSQFARLQAAWVAAAAQLQANAVEGNVT